MPDKKHLLFLHGAIGSGDQLIPLSHELKEEFHIHVIDFSGHGSNKNTVEEFSIQTFAKDVLNYLNENSIANCFVFGYSMGGYVALYLAKHFPEKILRVITLATKFNWDQEIAEKEIKNLNPEKIEEKVPAFAKALELRHGADRWKNVLHQTAAMMIKMGEKNPLDLKDYTGIEHDVLITIGDHDQMVTLEETVAVYRQLKNAKLFVVPNTKHPIESVNLKLMAFETRLFLSNERT